VVKHQFQTRINAVYTITVILDYNNNGEAFYHDTKLPYKKKKFKALSYAGAGIIIEDEMLMEEIEHCIKE
jgi:hypothetical protein